MNDTPPEILELLRELFNDIQSRFIDYFIGGLPVGLVMLPLTLVAVFLLYGITFAGMVPGIAAEDETLMLVGMLGGLGAGVLAMLVVLTVVLTPLNASLGRAMAKHLSGEESLSFSSAFSTATENLGSVMLYTVGHMLIGLVLTCFCYLPGILWYFATDLAWCRVVLEGESPVEALKKSLAHTQAHPSWHIGYFLVLFGVTMIVSYLPLIGTFLAPSMVMAWRVYAYSRGVQGAEALAKA